MPRQVEYVDEPDDGDRRVPLQEPGHTQVIIEGLACDIVLVASDMLELWFQVTPYLHGRVAQVEGDRDDWYAYAMWVGP